MAGFTAINALAAPDGDRSAEGAYAGPVTRSSSNGTIGDATKTVASDYLGRGIVDATIAEVKEASRPSFGSGAKKSGSSTKRRASTTTSQKNPKRQKPSDVASGLPVKKPRSHAKNKPAAVSASSVSVGAENSAANNSSNISFVTAPEHPPQSDASSVAAPQHPSQVVSIIAAPTSMHSLHSSSPRTSFDVVRSSGHGATVYQGAESGADRSNRTRNTPGTSMQQAKQGDAGATSQFLRSQKPKSASGTKATRGPRNAKAEAGVPEQVPEATSDDARTPAARVTRAAKKADPASSSLQKSTVSSRTLSEDFIGQDDEEGLIEILDRARAIRGKSDIPRPQQGSSSNAVQLSGTANASKPITASANKTKGMKRRATPILGPEEEFTQLCDENEEGFNELTDDVEEYDLTRSPTPPHRDKRLNLREVDPHEDYGGALLSDTDRELLGMVDIALLPSISLIFPPMHWRPRMLILKPAQLKSSQGQPADNPPILRKPFPLPILDRSPIFGATNTTMLRTCFRLGEALNVGSNAVRTNTNVILELYARVTSSHRDGRKQSFVFRDLYHDNPPWLEGTFELWGQSVLWDLDSKAFLGVEKKQGGLMCRLIGKMRKDAEKGGSTLR